MLISVLTRILLKTLGSKKTVNYNLNPVVVVKTYNIKARLSWVKTK